MLFDFSQKVYKEISRTGYNNKTKLIFWRVFQLFPRTLSPRLLQSQSLPATIPSKHPPLVLQNIILSFSSSVNQTRVHYNFPAISNMFLFVTLLSPQFNVQIQTSSYANLARSLRTSQFGGDGGASQFIANVKKKRISLPTFHNWLSVRTYSIKRKKVILN